MDVKVPLHYDIFFWECTKVHMLHHCSYTICTQSNTIDCLRQVRTTSVTKTAFQYARKRTVCNACNAMEAVHYKVGPNLVHCVNGVLYEKISLIELCERNLWVHVRGKLFMWTDLEILIDTRHRLITSQTLPLHLSLQIPSSGLGLVTTASGINQHTCNLLQLCKESLQSSAMIMERKANLLDWKYHYMYEAVTADDFWSFSS